MKDIADHLGVSQSTVSLALNNSPKISEATKAKVQAAAESLGYQSNPYVAALMSARRFGKVPSNPPVIAMVSAARDAVAWKERHSHTRFFKGCSIVADRLGIRIEHFWVGEAGMTAKRLNDIFYNRGIRGVILLPAGRYRERLNYDWKGVATISFGLYQLEPATDSVMPDHYGNMELARKRLTEEGFERVACIMDRKYPYQSDNRWWAAYAMGGISGQMETLEVWRDAEPDFEGFQAWFRRVAPDAIICVHLPTVVGWLEKMGLKVPDDISVASIGGAKHNGSFSGIVENGKTCGKIAMEVLMDRVSRGQFGHFENMHDVKIAGQWNRGETVDYKRGQRVE